MTRKRHIRRRRPSAAQTRAQSASAPTTPAPSSSDDVSSTPTPTPSSGPRPRALADLLSREARHHRTPEPEPPVDHATIVPTPPPEELPKPPVAADDDAPQPVQSIDSVGPVSDPAPATESAPAAPADDALTATIRRWARPTTPQELEERGVKRVRSVSMSRMASLIEKAVNKVLISRTLDGGTEEALSLSTSARKEFLRLARGEMQTPADDASPSRATSTLDRLRRELAERRKELAERESEYASAQAQATDEDAALQERLHELFAIHSPAGDQGRELETETMTVVLNEVREVRRRAREEQLAESMREIGQLERRISKLSVLLDETEEELRRVRQRRAIDPGVESIYDSVQGLDAADSRFEQKADLMKSIFEANLALRN